MSSSCLTVFPCVLEMNLYLRPSPFLQLWPGSFRRQSNAWLATEILGLARGTGISTREGSFTCVRVTCPIKLPFFWTDRELQFSPYSSSIAMSALHWDLLCLRCPACSHGCEKTSDNHTIFFACGWWYWQVKAVSSCLYLQNHNGLSHGCTCSEPCRLASVIPGFPELCTAYAWSGSLCLWPSLTHMAEGSSLSYSTL